VATYIIGDIQGCYTQLQALLKHVNFDAAHDRLWSVGDLVNRGSQSLEVLRFFRDLGERATVVLGNHDMHLLAIVYGDAGHLKAKDTFDKILHAPDRDDLLEWLRHCPMLYHDSDNAVTLIHAGLPPQWNLAEARAYAAEVENVLRGHQAKTFLRDHMYGNKPSKWKKSLHGWERIRFISNCLARLRYCTLDGALVLKKKYGPSSYDDGDMPWFRHPERATRDDLIIFGHWSTLGFYHGDNVYALDSGCLWGGHLSALRLEDRRVFHLNCPAEQHPGDF
jgi:bis(5'-nucleosyl)-tetraphosphatase (symmetrical)